MHAKEEELKSLKTQAIDERLPRNNRIKCPLERSHNMYCVERKNVLFFPFQTLFVKDRSVKAKKILYSSK